MANSGTNKDTGSSPIGYPGPMNNARHPGVYYENHIVNLTTSAAKILPGPLAMNGTRTVDNFTLWNMRSVGATNDPINVTLRLVTVPADVFTSSNEFPANYVGLPAEDVDCITLCDCETMRYCRIYPIYLKGNQFLVAYATENNVVRCTFMYRDGL